MTSRVLGIDPGTRVAGWGVVAGRDDALAVVACGVVRAPADEPIERRLVAIFEGVAAVLREHAVDLVAVEEAYAGKNVRSAIRLGEGRGVAILAAALAGREVVELSPASIKKSVAGHGAATKEQVRDALAALLPGSREAARGLPADASDALALAVAALARASSPFRQSTPRRRAGSRWTTADLARLSQKIVEDGHDG